MRVGTVRKGEGDRLDYDIDFADWLTDGDTIAEVEAVIDDNGGETPLAVDAVSAFNDDRKVKVWLSGGTYGTLYTVDMTVTTLLGRIKTVCFKVRMDPPC